MAFSPRPQSVSSRLIAAIACWCVAVAACSAALFISASRPGSAGAAPQQRPDWLSDPTDSSATLVVAVHPKCPCTRATLANLEQAAGTCRFVALIYTPQAPPTDWADTATVRKLRDAFNARIVADTEGQLAASLGADTSGHVLLYNPQGRLLFSGGITPSRGHQGACLPMETLNRLIAVPAAAPASPTVFTVFGCPLSTANCTDQIGCRDDR